MIRKFAIALAATAVIAVTALTPTAASAHHWHGGVRIYVPTVYADTCYTKKVVVDTWNGPRVRRVTYCN